MDKIYMIGTLFEEDEMDKKMNYYNQKVRDDKGHKRFTGAFTGGLKEFDIGYRGTCGSEEGFQPQKFVSSRTNRYQGELQKLSSLMDDDDIGSQRIGQNLITNQIYGSSESKPKDSIDFLLSTKKVQDSIGIQILKNIKQIQSQKKLEKLRQNNEVPQEEEEDEATHIIDKDMIQLRSFSQRIKDDFKGLGFVDENEDTTDDQLKQRFNLLMGKKTGQSSEQEQEQQNQNSNIRMFGGNYNADSDEDIQMNYNLEGEINEIEDLEKILDSEEEYKTKKKRKINENLTRQSIEDIFVKKQQIQVSIHKNEIKVPPDFNPLKKVQSFNLKHDQEQINFTEQYKRKYDLQQRQKLIETQEKFKNQVQTKEFVRGKDQEMGADEMKELFSMSPRKAERFKYFCLEKQGKVVGGSQAYYMTYKEQQQEIKEFDGLYQKYEEQRQKKLLMESKMIDLKQKLDQLKNFRKTEKWFPDKLLCKRFGCQPPYSDREYQINDRMKDSQQKIEKIQDSQRSNLSKGNLSKEDQEKLEKQEDIIQANEMKLYGLPTQFKGDRGVPRFRSGGFQTENGEKSSEDEDEGENEELDPSKAKQDHAEEQITQVQEQDDEDIHSQASDKEDEITEKVPISLFKSIFSDDSD